MLTLAGMREILSAALAVPEADIAPTTEIALPQLPIEHLGEALRPIPEGAGNDNVGPQLEREPVIEMVH